MADKVESSMAFARATQIASLVARLEELWQEHPELRLGQLIGNVYHYPSGIDPYFDADELFLEKLEAFYADILKA